MHQMIYHKLWAIKNDIKLTRISWEPRIFVGRHMATNNKKALYNCHFNAIFEQMKMRGCAKNVSFIFDVLFFHVASSGNLYWMIIDKWSN